MDRVKTSQNGTFLSFEESIAFESLHICKNENLKLVQCTFSFTSLELIFGGWQLLGVVEHFQNFSKLEGANKLKWVEKIESSVINPSTNREEYN